MNTEWYLGKNKRGCEGIFPISYLEVKKPLQQIQNQNTNNSSSTPCNKIVRVLYNFDAETLEDLTLRVSCD